jgi:Xaa-Pro dipeptidase
MDIKKIQGALAEKGFDGWLMCDFHNRDHLAYRVLGIDFKKMTSRRWFYFIPAKGEPVRLLSAVEPARLDALPGEKRFYRAWGELHAALKDMLGGPKKLAMEYSPLNNIPYVSIVDAGTIEIIRGFGHEIVSSADLVQQFEAIIDRKGYESHLKAGEKIQRIKDEAFAEIGKALGQKRKLTEYELARFILRRFDEEGLDSGGESPIVGINDHPADPHFEPKPEGTYTFKKGDTVLIDLWAKLKEPGSIFYDITWCGFIGDEPSAKYKEIFRVVRDGRIAAVNFVRESFASGKPCFGWEVDRALDRRRGARERGQHRQSRDQGRADDRAGHMLLHRTGHLPQG